MSLYYLLSSLPMLTFEGAPALPVEAFLEACREQLSRADADAVAALAHGSPSAHPLVAEWRDKEAILRNAAARERAAATGSDAERWLRPTAGCDTLIESLVEDAFQEPDPLKKERALDRARWWIAEELQGPDPLTVRAVFSYAVKLAILSRWRALSPEAGREVFGALCRVSVPLGAEAD